MRAELDAKGVLVVSAENPTESTALQWWLSKANLGEVKVTARLGFAYDEMSCIRGSMFSVKTDVPAEPPPRTSPFSGEEPPPPPVTRKFEPIDF